MLKKFNKKGSMSIEYILIVVLVVLALVTALVTLGGKMGDTVTEAGDAISTKVSAQLNSLDDAD